MVHNINETLQNLNNRHKASEDLGKFLNHRRYAATLQQHNNPKKWALLYCLLLANSTAAFSQGQIKATAPMFREKLGINIHSSALIYSLGLFGALSIALFSAKNSQLFAKDIYYHHKNHQKLNEIGRSILPGFNNGVDTVNPRLLDDSENAKIEKDLLYYLQKELRQYTANTVLALVITGLSVFASVGMQRENDANLFQIITAFISSALNNGYNMTKMCGRFHDVYLGYKYDTTQLYREFYDYLQQAKQLPIDTKYELLDELDNPDLATSLDTYHDQPLDAFASLMTQLQILRNRVDMSKNTLLSNNDMVAPKSNFNNKQLKTLILGTLGLGLLASAAGGAIPYGFMWEDLKKHYPKVLAGIFTGASTSNNFVINAIAAFYLLSKLTVMMDGLAYLGNNCSNYSGGDGFILGLAGLTAGLVTLLPMLSTGLFYTFNTEQNHGSQSIAGFSGVANMANNASGTSQDTKAIIYQPVHNRIFEGNTHIDITTKKLAKHLDTMNDQVTELKNNHPFLMYCCLQKARDNTLTQTSSYVSLNTQEESSLTSATPVSSNDESSSSDDQTTIQASKNQHYQFWRDILCYPDIAPTSINPTQHGTPSPTNLA